MGIWFCKWLLTADGCGERGLINADPACTGRPNPTVFEEHWLQHCRLRLRQ
jgi:hypothetical protein